jgi:predicted nucleic acid-binding protein
VKAITRDRELVAEEDRSRQRLDEAGRRQPLLIVEIDAAKRRLEELEAEQRKLATLPLTVAATIRAVADHRQEHPLAFLSAEELVDRSIRNQSQGVLKLSDADEEGWS